MKLITEVVVKTVTKKEKMIIFPHMRAAAQSSDANCLLNPSERREEFLNCDGIACGDCIFQKYNYELLEAQNGD